MGQLVLTVVGGAVGSLFGMPQLGMIVGGAIGGALFGGSGGGGPRLEDKTVSASTYGVAIPRTFGTVRLASNLIWTAGIKEHPHSGGKGMGGPKTYSYTCSFAVAFCVGEVDEILRIWADTKLIFGAADMNSLRDALKNGADFGTLIGTYRLGKKKKKYKIRVYRGSEDQLPDAAIVANKGADETPAYRGLCYAVFEDMPLTDFGNRIPNISAEVTRSKQAVVPSLTFETLEGTEAYLSGAYFDWDANRAVNVEGTNFVVYSLRTMKQIASFPMPTGQAGTKIGYCPGAGPVVMQYGNSNSRKVVLLDGTTFTPYHTMGTVSNSLGEYPFNECLGEPGDGGVTAYLVANGYFHCFRILKKNSYAYYWINFNGFGGNSVWDFNGNFVNFLNRNGNALTLSETEGTTQFCVWGGNNDGSVWLDKYTYSGDVATMDKEDSSTCERSYKEVIKTFGDLGGPDTYTIAPPRGGTIQNLIYNESDDTILFTCYDGAHPYIAIWSVTDGAFLRVFDAPGTHQIEGLSRSRLTGYKLGYGDFHDTSVITIDLNTGDYTEQGLNVFTIYASTNIWDDATQSVYFATLGNGNHWVRVFSQNLPLEVSVGSIVQEILDDTGQLAPTDYDVSALYDIPVTGYLVGRESTARDIVTQLAGAYFFDGVESDYQLKFVKRGGASKVTIVEDQMGNVEGRDVQLKETLAQETEAPMRVTVNYMDQDRDYQTASQFAKRISNPFPAVNTRREDKAELPIVLNADQGKQMADKALKAAWVSRVSNEAVLPWRFLKYDPTDVVTYTMNDGSTRIARLTKMDIGDDLSIKVAGVNDSAVAYVSNLTGDSGSVPPQVAGDPTPADLVVMNTPLLRDIDDTQGVGSVLYLSAVTPTGPFGGAYLQKAEPGDDFNDIGMVSKEPIAGYCVQTLAPTHSWGSTDTTSVIRVALYDPNQTLESISYDELMAGKNLALVGKEIIQFQNAEQEASGFWALTNILRARRGTDPYLDSHVVGEGFFMPDTNGSVVLNTRVTIDEKHNERIRATVAGDVVDDSIGLTYEIDPNDLRPYTVANVRIADITGGISITFDRRSRITNTLTDGTPDIPYREGDTASGNYAYKVWSTTMGPTAKPWVNPTDGTSLREGSIGVAGIVDGTLTILDPQIDLADVGDLAIGTQLVVQITHNGFVTGFPTYRYFEKQGDETWVVTELFS